MASQSSDFIFRQRTDPQQGTLPPSALTWTLLLHNCVSTCTVTTLQQFLGVASGTFTAPNAPYPSHLELRLTATDNQGLNVESRLLNPQTVILTFKSKPGSLIFGWVSTTIRYAHHNCWFAKYNQCPHSPSD